MFKSRFNYALFKRRNVLKEINLYKENINRII
jgi:hypothetical protein